MCPKRRASRMRRLLLLPLLIATAACVRMAPVSRTPYDGWINDLNERLRWEQNGELRPLGALKQALEESRRFHYTAEPAAAPWKTPLELAEAGGSDCKNLAIWTISRAWTLSPGIHITLVVGQMKFRGEHAWVEVDAGGQVWWADPSVRQGKRLGLAATFYDRIPHYAYAYDGAIFGPQYAFVWVRR
jgi:hypothetical protein